MRYYIRTETHDKIKEPFLCAIKQQIQFSLRGNIKEERLNFQTKVLGIKCLELQSTMPSPLRYIILVFKTIKFFLTNRHEVVFVQNPSNILAALVCMLANIYQFVVIVDRHSNFIFSKEDAMEYPRLAVFLGNQLSSFSLAQAGLTIVTNEHIQRIAMAQGGRAFILPDKLPELSLGSRINLAGKYKIIFPCTFSPDEPVAEVIKAAALLKKEVVIYTTGNFKKVANMDEFTIPDNVVFTGFLAEDEYQSYIKSCDMVLALTIRDHTLLCSAYEAVSLKKPMILSDKSDLTKYFYKGHISTDNSSESIANAINECIAKYDELCDSIAELHFELDKSWEKQYNKLLNEISMVVKGNI